MKKVEIKLGHIYRMKVSGKLTRVRIDSESPFGGWSGTNLLTHREVRIRTAAKLRFEVDPSSPLGHPKPVKKQEAEPLDWCGTKQLAEEAEKGKQ